MPTVESIAITAVILYLTASLGVVLLLGAIGCFEKKALMLTASWLIGILLMVASIFLINPQAASLDSPNVPGEGREHRERPVPPGC